MNEKNTKHIWGPEVVGLCVMMNGGAEHGMGVWTRGRILSYDSSNRTHTLVMRDGKIFEVDLHLYKMKSHTQE